MADLDAYAVDCRLYGQVELGDGRMSDQLNSTLELHIRDAKLQDLVDGHVVALPELTVDHAELCAVVATGPRGDAARRLSTRTTRVEVEIGPYHVIGRVHGPPTANPFAAVLKRGAWLPLTEATVVYWRGAEEIKEPVATLLVNRHLMKSFREF